MLLLAVPYLLSAVSCAVITVVAWRRRSVTPAAGWLALVMAGLSWWAAVDLAGVVVAEVVDMQARGVVQLGIYPGVAAVVAGFFLMCRVLSEPDWQPTPRLLAALAVEPVLLVATAASNPWHGLLVAPAAAGSAESFSYGPLFWLHTTYSYSLLGAALLRVVRTRRHANALQARQLGTLLLAAGFPVVGNIVTVAGFGGTLDLTALFFVLTGLLDAHAVFRQGLFQIVPVARAQVFERLDAAVLVLDEQDRLGDANTAAGELMSRAVPCGRPVPGLPAAEALGGLAPLLHAEGEHAVQLCDGPADLDVRVTELRDRHGRWLGRVLVVHDVTEATSQRRQLAAANEALHAQVETIERLRAEVAEQAVRDPLTRLHNRRYLTDRLDAAVEAAGAGGGPVSLALLDIDHFKAVNDRHGHAAGDRVLLAVSDRLRADLRDGECVARHGGEEFVLLMPGLDPAAAAERAEEVRRSAGSTQVPAREGTVRVTLSAGVASLSEAVPDADALLEAADRALYAAKAAGRDCLRTAPGIPAQRRPAVPVGQAGGGL